MTHRDIVIRVQWPEGYGARYTDGMETAGAWQERYLKTIAAELTEANHPLRYQVLGWRDELSDAPAETPPRPTCHCRTSGYLREHYRDRYCGVPA